MGKMEQVCDGIVGTHHEVEACLYHIEQQHGNKGKRKRDQSAAKEKIVQTQIAEEKLQRIAQRPAAGNAALLFFRNRDV